VPSSNFLNQILFRHILVFVVSELTKDFFAVASKFSFKHFFMLLRLVFGFSVDLVEHSARRWWFLIVIITTLNRNLLNLTLTPVLLSLLACFTFSTSASTDTPISVVVVENNNLVLVTHHDLLLGVHKRRLFLYKIELLSFEGG
jgi:hypothetical protein